MGNNKIDLNQIITDTFEIDVEDINDSLSPENVEKWDSLGQLQLLATIEAHYNISFEINEVFQIFNLGDIRRILIEKGIK